MPVTIRELLDLIEGLKHRLVYSDVDEFYQVSRAIMVKDEKHYDKFDQAFGVYFRTEDLQGLLESLIPDEFLRREFERSLTAEEPKRLKAWAALRSSSKNSVRPRSLRKRAVGRRRRRRARPRRQGEQEGQGGQGPNSSGGRGGREEKKGKKAWDRRAYKNLDDSASLARVTSSLPCSACGSWPAP